MKGHRWTGCAVRLGDGQYSNCGYSFGGSWLTAARPAGTADRRISGQPVAAIAAETGLSRHADNTDPSRAQYLRPYLVRAVRRTVSGASCRTRSALSITRGAPPPPEGPTVCVARGAGPITPDHRVESGRRCTGL